MERPGYVSVKYLGSAFPFSFSLSFFFVLGFFQKGAFDPTREDFLKKGHLDWDLEIHLQMDEVT